MKSKRYSGVHTATMTTLLKSNCTGYLKSVALIIIFSFAATNRERRRRLCAKFALFDGKHLLTVRLSPYKPIFYLIIVENVTLDLTEPIDVFCEWVDLSHEKNQENEDEYEEEEDDGEYEEKNPRRRVVSHESGQSDYDSS